MNEADVTYFGSPIGSAHVNDFGCMFGKLGHVWKMLLQVLVKPSSQ